MEQLLDRRKRNADCVSDTLVAYRKELYYAGKSYGRYSETRDAVANAEEVAGRGLGSSLRLGY